MTRHYKIQTDFGVMKFDSNSVLGYWWEFQDVKEVISEVSIDAGSVRGNVFRFVRRLFRWNVPWR